MKIKIPDWVKIYNYRTMTDEKKNLAVNGNKLYQYEWMKEEVNEFYEAVKLANNEEIRDEAIGLIRTFQQFQNSIRVVSLWKKVRKDVLIVFMTRKIFLETFCFNNNTRHDAIYPNDSTSQLLEHCLRK